MVQGHALSWNVHKLGCFNILRSIKSVEFSNLEDGRVCYPEVARILEEEAEEGAVLGGLPDTGITVDNEVDNMNLLVNILIIAGVGSIVLLICIIGLCRQCRGCLTRVLCCGRCCKSTYHVSAMEGRAGAGYRAVSLATSTSNNTSPNTNSSSGRSHSNTSSILQY